MTRMCQTVSIYRSETTDNGWLIIDSISNAAKPQRHKVRGQRHKAIGENAVFKNKDSIKIKGLKHSIQVPKSFISWRAHQDLNLGPSDS